MTGFVYFARRGRGVIKIGASWRPDLRVRALRRSSPNLELIGFVEGGGMHEAYAHRVLASHRIVGEWYWPRPTVLMFIEQAVRRGYLPGWAQWWANLHARGA